MTKKRADGSTVEAKLQRARDLLYNLRADLQTASEEHDQRLAAVVRATNDRFKADLATHADKINDVNLLLVQMSRKGDNVEARIRGRKKLHREGLKPVQQLLSEAKSLLSGMRERMVSLGGDSDVDKFITSVINEFAFAYDNGELGSVDEDMSDLEEELEETSPATFDEDLDGFEDPVELPASELKELMETPAVAI